MLIYTFDKKIYEMKLWFRNYTVIIPTENKIYHINNKVNSLQTFDIAQNYRILHKVVQRLSQHNLSISNHHHIQKLRQIK
jgi:aspartate/glutamate racemase